MTFSKTILVKPVGVNNNDFDAIFIDAIRNRGGELPEDLADTFVITMYQAEDGWRGILNFA